MGFNNGQQYKNAPETARARQIKLIDKRIIEVLKSSTLLVQVKCNRILIVYVEKQLIFNVFLIIS